MKMCKAMPMFVLLFTGYLCTTTNVTTETTSSDFTSTSTSSALKDRETPALETPPRESDPVPEKHLSTILVAGISISLVLFFVLVATGVWYARRRSKAEMNSIPSGEPGVSLQSISTHENQHEWPFESITVTAGRPLQDPVW